MNALPPAAPTLSDSTPMKSHPARRLHRAAGLLVAAVALALAAPRAAAQPTFNPPERMTYQGFLTDGNGVALGNDAPKNYDVIFRIYNHESNGGAARLWAEQQTVTVDKGYFSVLLGEGASTGEPRPVLSTLFKGPNASDRYVGITVKGIGPGGANVDILPRLRLMAAPYSFLSQNAVRLVQDTGADLITSSGNAVTVSGTVAANSFSGNGASLNSLNAGNIASGTLADGRLSGNVALRNGGNTFNGNQIINNALGIGTAPGVKLHVVDNSSWVVGAMESSHGAGTWLALGNSSAGGRYWQMISSGAGNGEGAGKLLIGHGTGAGGSTPRMTLQDNGNVGIGTSFPDRTLHVNGSVGVAFSNPLEFGRGYTKEQSAGQIGYGTHSGGAGGTLDIVGAGTTGGNRRIQMWAEGGLTLNGSIVNGLNVANGWGRMFEVPGDYFQVFNATDKNKRFIMFRYGSGVGLRGFGGGWGNASGDERTITWDGDGNWDSSSDRRLKKDIVDAEPMLDRTLKVQVRRFHWKSDPDDAKLSLGVVAQELQPLFPEMVSVQEGPASDKNNEKTLAVGYSDFGLIAVKALQEFKAQHDAEVGALKSEAAELKAQVADLKAQMADVIRLNAELRNRFEKETVTAVANR